MPIAEALQWSAQLAIDRGVEIVYNSQSLARERDKEFEEIING